MENTTTGIATLLLYTHYYRHVHVETRRRITRFEVRSTQVPPLMHECVCDEKGNAYNMVYIYTDIIPIHTQRTTTVTYVL